MQSRSSLRNIRIQLKNGFLKVPPADFEALKRAPSVIDPNTARFEYIKKAEIPYLKLYEKLKKTNPFLQVENVTVEGVVQDGMIVAKNMHKMMKDGVPEAEAFRKASQFIHDRDNSAFVELKNLVHTLETEGPAKFTVHPDIEKSFSFWKTRLATEAYHELASWEQSFLDRFVHFYILKWNDSAREKRMCDEVFAPYYVRLINALFPLDESVKEKQFLKWKENTEETLSHVYAKNPFYVEDYLKFYEKLKTTPNFRMDWSEEDKKQLESWVRHTLCFDSALVTKSGKKMSKEDYQVFVTRVFFPMLAFPKRNRHLPTLTVESMKKALYENQIGYRKGTVQQNKTFVLRFSQIPALLFPRDVFCSTLVSRKDVFPKCLEDDTLLEAEMEKFGISKDLLTEVKIQLEEYQFAQDFNVNLDIYSQSGSENVIEDILGELKVKKEKSSDGKGKVQAPNPITERTEYINYLKKQFYDNYANANKDILYITGTHAKSPKDQIPVLYAADKQFVAELRKSGKPEIEAFLNPATELERERVEIFISKNHNVLHEQYAEGAAENWVSKKEAFLLKQRRTLQKQYKVKESFRTKILGMIHGDPFFATNPLSTGVFFDDVADYQFIKSQLDEYIATGKAKPAKQETSTFDRIQEMENFFENYRKFDGKKIVVNLLIKHGIISSDKVIPQTGLVTNEELLNAFDDFQAKTGKSMYTVAKQAFDQL